MQSRDGPAGAGGTRDAAREMQRSGGLVHAERRRLADGQQQLGAAPAETSYGQLHGQNMRPADLRGKLQQQQASSSDKL